MRDTVAEMAAKAHEISLEAGSKMAAAMKDVIGAAAGYSAFAIESARDLVQYMVRRGQMTQDEADKLIREAEAAHVKNPKTLIPKPEIKVEVKKPTMIPVAVEAPVAPVAVAAAPVLPPKAPVKPVQSAPPTAAPKPAVVAPPKVAAAPVAHAGKVAAAKPAPTAGAKTVAAKPAAKKVPVAAAPPTATAKPPAAKKAPTVAKAATKKK